MLNFQNYENKSQGIDFLKFTLFERMTFDSDVSIIVVANYRFLTREKSLCVVYNYGQFAFLRSKMES